VIATDTWVSMGQEGEQRGDVFAPFAVDAAAMTTRAASDAIVLHCLPRTGARRSRPRSSTVPRASCGTRPRTGCTRRRRCWPGCWIAADEQHEVRGDDEGARHGRIIALLVGQQVRSQTELAALLDDEGLHVTQATLSRDLDELGAVKLRTPDGGAPMYVIPEDGSPLAAGGRRRPAARLARLVAELLTSAEASANLVVLRTRPGRRSSSRPPSIAPAYPRCSAPSPGMTPSWSWRAIQPEGRTSHADSRTGPISIRTEGGVIR